MYIYTYVCICYVPKGVTVRPSKAPFFTEPAEIYIYIYICVYAVSELKIPKVEKSSAGGPVTHAEPEAHSASVRPSKILTVSVTSRIKKDLGSQKHHTKTMRTD